MNMCVCAIALYYSTIIGYQMFALDTVPHRVIQQGGSGNKVYF